MIKQDGIIASLPDAQLSLGALLRHLHNQGRLKPLILETLLSQLVHVHARRDGLFITDEELQASADAYRRLQGLHKAADTRFWLSLRGMTVDGFEENLEESLLAIKLKRHLTSERVEEYFAEHRDELEQLHLAQLLVERDDLARELASQIRDEGRDLESVAREQGRKIIRHQMYRKNLNGSMALALHSAKSGELVGPIETARGFALIVLEQRRPAELDPRTRNHIEDELFEDWLANQMREAEFDLSMLETA